MKKILFIILMPFILFAQHKANLTTDPSFDNAPTWSTTGTWAVSGGTGNAVNETSALLYEAGPGVTTNTHYKVKVEIVDYTDGSIRMRYSGTTYATPTNRASADTVSSYGFDINTDGTPYDNAVIFGDAAATLKVDNFYYLEWIDTLWTDGAQADETDDDTTKTLSEAFEIRGTHTGGNFITVAGTYDEAVVVDTLGGGTSFTKWEASGAATVTSVNFNNVTATVDMLNLTIGTAINDGNITYLNAPATGVGGYGQQKQQGQWRGWR